MPNRGGEGGGSEGGLAKDQTFSGFCFVQPSLKKKQQSEHCDADEADYKHFCFGKKLQTQTSTPASTTRPSGSITATWEIIIHLTAQRGNLNMVSRETNGASSHGEAVRCKSLEGHWTCLGHAWAKTGLHTTMRNSD